LTDAAAQQVHAGVEVVSSSLPKARLKVARLAVAVVASVERCRLAQPGSYSVTDANVQSP